MKPWLEIKAKGRPETKDEASFIPKNAGSPGVLETDSLLTAYLPASFEGIKSLRKKLKITGWKFVISPYREENWAEKWKRYIRPIRAGGFFVKPAFLKAMKRKK